MWLGLTPVKIIMVPAMIESTARNWPVSTPAISRAPSRRPLSSSAAPALSAIRLTARVLKRVRSLTMPTERMPPQSGPPASCTRKPMGGPQRIPASR